MIVLYGIVLGAVVTWEPMRLRLRCWSFVSVLSCSLRLKLCYGRLLLQYCTVLCVWVTIIQSTTGRGTV
jgi:hypothetical protein